MAVVAPSGPAAAAPLRDGLQILSARYTIVHTYSPAVPGEAHPPYLSDTDQRRAELFNRAVADEEVEAIFCARGGYGAMRILELLDGELYRRRRPLLVGLSDITALHAWAAGLEVPTIHGPVVTQLGALPKGNLQSLYALIEGRGAPLLSGLEPLAGGRASGPLLGGNLTLLSHLCGTPYMPHFLGHILLLEEVAESPYRIDRMLTQLRLAGVLDGLAGIVLGQFLRCDAPQGTPPTPVTAREVLFDRLGRLGIPVAWGAPVGHGETNVALPMGLPAHLDADGGTLIFKVEP